MDAWDEGLGVLLPALWWQPSHLPTPSTAPPPPWLDSFHSFSPLHAVMVVVAGSVLASLCAAARRAGGARAKMIARRWGYFIFAWQTLEVGYYARLWDIQVSLPLQICDLAAWSAGLALVTERRGFRAMLYFWGIGLSSQAFVTPTVTVGPAHLKFWLFWVAHSNIVLGGLFDVIVRGYRPTWRDFSFASLVTLGYGAVVLPVNSLAKVNYGYVGDSRPGAATIVDRLGAWPLRILWIGVIVYSVFTVLTLAWARNRPGRGRVIPTPAPPSGPGLD